MTRNDSTDDGTDRDRLTRRRLLYSGAVSSLIFTAGCGSGGSDSGTDDGSDGGSDGDGDGGSDGGGDGGMDTDTDGGMDGDATTLSVASWGGETEQEIVNGILDEYDSSNDSVRIEYQNTPFGEYSQTLQTQFAGDEEPDVFYLIADDAPTFMRNGALLALDDYVRGDDAFNLDDILDNLLEPFTYEGTIYGIPKDFTPVGLMYNTAHLDQAGAPDPETWSDMRTALEMVKSETDVEYPMAVGSQPRNTLMQLVWQNGGDVLNEDGTEAVIGSQEAIEALEFLNGLVEDDLAGIYEQDIEATWAAPALGEGTTTMAMTGAWVISTLEGDYSEVYDALEVGMPVPEGGEEATVVFTTSWSASANTDAPDAAAGLVKALTNEEGMWDWASTGTALPSRQSLLERDFYDDRPLLDGLGDLGSVGRPLVFGPKTPTILDSIMTEAEAVLTGDKDPATALENAQRQINQEL